MEELVREIVARIAEVPNDFSAEAHLRDELNIDSFRAAELSFELERVFKTKIPDEHFLAAETFNDLLKLLSSVAA